MSAEKFTILAVDDELFNLDILVESLEDEGYEVVTAENGTKAWAAIEETPDRFDLVLLDRMMPDMDGIEVLKKIKEHSEYCNIPVVMQTAKASKDDIKEGLESGAYYYLTKPFEQDTLLSIVRTAIGDNVRYCALQNEVEQTSQTLTFLDKGVFTFRTLQEGRSVSTLLSNACPDPDKIVLGLSELVINAVEHGNLGITYDEKTALHKNGTWEEEIERRSLLDENIGKTVTIEFERRATGGYFLVRDQGSGFDWENYMQLSPDRAFDSHGRGVAMANIMSFDRLEYRDPGNEVLATFNY